MVKCINISCFAYKQNYKITEVEIKHQKKIWQSKYGWERNLKGL